MRSRSLLVAVALMGVMSIAPGCSSEQTTRTTTQTTASNPDGAPAQSDSTMYAQSPPAITSTTTTTTTSEPDSVLGAAFHLVGTIILLPFRIIGLLV
jgi:hypothetical protein